MSTNRNDLESEFSNPVGVTSFSGDADRGRCLQLTQQLPDNASGWGSHGVVQMDREQTLQFIADATRWLAGE